MNLNNEMEELRPEPSSPFDRSIHSAASIRPTTIGRDAWTETKTVKNRHLSTIEAASLIVNKMIGTGIFTTPGIVLQLTQSKKVALGLWILGGFYAGLWFALLLRAQAHMVG